MKNEEFWISIKRLIDENQLISAVFSSPLDRNSVSKISIRPVTLKGKHHFQITEFRGAQTFHRNVTALECFSLIEEKVLQFKQTVLFTQEADFHVLTNKKGLSTLLKKPPSHKLKQQTHNRIKSYVIEEGEDVPFLQKLGVMDLKGRVLPKMSHKFRQINRFLEIISDVAVHLDPNRQIQIVDFGCGKAYLTFALYHLLKIKRGMNVRIIGLDLKKQVIQDCQKLALDLQYDSLQFSLGDISQYESKTPVDMVVSLHACDTATDAALIKAIGWNAGIILCVPCCQHELYKQVESEDLQPLLKHGILKERFASLATDAARAQVLEIAGYQTQVMEFIDLEHTPKNLLIRAIRRERPVDTKSLSEAYSRFKQALSIRPAIDGAVS